MEDGASEVKGHSFFTAEVNSATWLISFFVEGLFYMNYRKNKWFDVLRVKKGKRVKQEHNLGW